MMWERSSGGRRSPAMRTSAAGTRPSSKGIRRHAVGGLKCCFSSSRRPCRPPRWLLKRSDSPLLLEAGGAVSSACCIVFVVTMSHQHQQLRDKPEHDQS